MQGWSGLGKQRSNKALFIVIGVLVIVLIAVAIATGGSRTNYDGFAQCLVDKGVIMAGTSWCSHCAAQKEAFKGSFERVIAAQGSYKDCDAQPAWCQEHGITGYPTWVMPDGNLVPGTQKLETLERMTGCSRST